MENKLAESFSFVKGLIELGFSENEAMVYTALLKLGHGTVSQISRAAGINRTTGYDILDRLSSQKLANVSGHEPKQEYVAEAPEKLRAILEARRATAERVLRESEKLIPQLSSMYQRGARPRVMFYEGEEGLKQVYEDTLTSHEPIRAYATIDDMHKALPNYFPKYYKRRAEKGISIRGIVPKTPSALERSKHNIEEKREIAFVPPDIYYFSPEIDIYDDKVMIASWREKLGIIIESAEIADAMKKIYELAWESAKRMERSPGGDQKDP
jgi:sugar-specific transcriptional regulator TrmB